MTIPIDYFSHIPVELTTLIASHLAPEDLLNVGLVSTIFSKVVEDNALWPLPKALTLLGAPPSHKEALLGNLQRRCRFLWRLCQGDSVAKASESLSLFQADRFLRDAILRPIDCFPFPYEVWYHYDRLVTPPSLPITRENIHMIVTLRLVMPKKWAARACAAADIPKILIEQLVIQCQHFEIAPEAMRADRDFVLRFIRSGHQEYRGTIFEYLSDRLKKDFELMREFVLQKPLELCHVDENTQYIDPKTGEIDPLSKERYAEIVQAASQGRSAQPQGEDMPRYVPKMYVPNLLPE